MGLIRRACAGYSPQLHAFAKRPFTSFNLSGGRLNAAAASALIHGIHVFHCPDEVGIVAKLSECIASRGGNILTADVFVPEKENVFYARSGFEPLRGIKSCLLPVRGCHYTTHFPHIAPHALSESDMDAFPIVYLVRSEFVFDPAKWPREQIDEDFSKLAKMFNAMRSVVRVPQLDPKYKIGVLASKQDHCLVDLLHAWQDSKLPVDITAVISNHDRGPDTHVMRFLGRHEIPYHYLDTTKEGKNEGDILDLVKDTDFLVLARYMQILSGDFLKSYGKDIINIHHGLLPSFKGGNPSKQAFDAGVKLIGATTHFVTEQLDEGPIIEQMVERVSHRDNLRSFVHKSENLEKQCLAKAIKNYCELRVLLYVKNKTVVF